VTEPEETVRLRASFSDGTGATHDGPEFTGTVYDPS
jgi:hypothetical protein